MKSLEKYIEETLFYSLTLHLYISINFHLSSSQSYSAVSCFISIFQILLLFLV